MTNPRQYKIPDWFLNRQKDIVDGKYSQVRYPASSQLTYFVLDNQSYPVCFNFS